MRNSHPFPTDAIVWFYDEKGEPLFYLFGKEHFYHVDGAALGYLFYHVHVMSYDGRFLGWIEDGWIIDYKDGSHAFYSDYAEGGPARPGPKEKPLRGVQKPRPMKLPHAVRPQRPERLSEWTKKDIATFFPDYPS